MCLDVYVWHVCVTMLGLGCWCLHVRLASLLLLLLLLFCCMYVLVPGRVRLASVCPCDAPCNTFYK